MKDLILVGVKCPKCERLFLPPSIGAVVHCTKCHTEITDYQMQIIKRD